MIAWLRDAFVRRSRARVRRLEAAPPVRAPAQRRRARAPRASRGAVLAWLLASALAPAAGVAPPVTLETATIALPGFDETVDIHRPAATAPIGIAIFAHGFGRSRHRHYDLGRALAEAGVVAIIPDLPNVMDLWANGDAVAELAARVESGAFGLPPAPRSRIVLMGTSAGGLATLLAADRMPGLAGWIGLDPVDRTGTGADAAARLAVPAIVLLADNSHCNLIGSGRTLARALPRLVRSTKIEGASHCDFESPTNNFCRVICGTSPPDRESRVRDETVAATIELLTGARGEDGAPPAPPGNGATRD
jgi:dienelactone hydrolase